MNELIFAVRKQDFNKSRELLQNGHNPNVHHEDGRTPLHHAVRQSNEPMVNLLLEYGARPNITSNYWGSIWSIALKKRNPNIIKALKEKGAQHSPQERILANATSNFPLS